MFESDGCVQRWLRGLAESTGKNRLRVLKTFFDFVKVSPSEAVVFQREHPNDYKFVEVVYDWLDARSLRINTIKTQLGCVRGFFLANRAPMPKDRHRFHSEREPVVGELSVEEFKKILTGCNLTYRSAFLVQFQSGSGVKELAYINEFHAEHVWNEVRKGARTIRLTMPGRKQNRNVRPYYTFIGSDAVEALKQLFHSKGWKRDDVLFRTEYGKPVSASSLQSYFKVRAFKLGILKAYTPKCPDCGEETVKKHHRKEGRKWLYYLCTACQSEHLPAEFEHERKEWTHVRYRLRTHELRDLFRTEFHRAQTYNGADPDAAEFFMGHGIDSLMYDKIMRDKSYGLQQYRKAMSFLNILSEDPRKVDRTEIDSKLESQKAREEALSSRIVELERKMAVLDDPLVLEAIRDARKKKE